MSDDFTFDNEEQDEPTNPVDYSAYIFIVLKILFLLIIVYGVYYYLYASVVNLNVIIMEKDGTSINTTINISQNGKLINSFDSTDTIKLRNLFYKNKTYQLEILNLPIGHYAKNYDLQISLEDITDKSISKTIYVYPEWSGQINNAKISYPPTVYKGQDLDIKLTFTYTGKPVTIALKGTGDLNIIDLRKEIKSGNQEIIINYFVSSTNKKLSGRICIKQTDICTNDINASIEAQPVITIDKVSSNITTALGSSFDISFNINNSKNKNLTLKDVNIYVASVSGIDKESFASWLNHINLYNIDAGTKDNVVRISGKVPVNISPQKINVTFGIINNIISKDSGTINIDIKPANIKVDDKKDFGLMLAGSNNLINIMIQNDSESNIQINEVNIDNVIAQKTLPDTIKSWVSIPIQYKSFQLEKTKTQNIPITITLPINANTDEFSFNLNINSNAGAYTSRITGKIKGILFKPVINLNQTEYNITYDTITNISKPIVKIFNIENQGDVNFAIKDIYVDGDPICKNINNVKITKPLVLSLDPNTNREATLEIKNIPKPVTSQINTCKILVSYINPLTGQNTESDILDKTFIINT